jgi:cytochrome c556
MKKKLVAGGVIAALGAAAALNAYAQAKPEVLVKQRQAGMTLIGKYFGPLGAMAQGKAPYNAQIVSRNAGYLQVLSRLPWDGFDASTANEKNTKALPAVYSNHAKFSQAATDMQNAVDKLAAAKASDEAATKQAIGAVGKTCGGCHENFRRK